VTTAADDFERLLREYESDVPGAEARLADAVFEDLRHMAQLRLTKRFGKGLPGMTIQPTVLATDTMLKMLRQRNQPTDRKHFFALAAQQMWRLLADYERQRQRHRPQGGPVLVSIDLERDDGPQQGLDPVNVAALRDAIAKLEALDPRVTEVFQRRILFGLSINETAAAMGLGHATVERHYAFARAWLAKDLRGGDTGPAHS
jgi:RNA polymerase sigma factor (TIGR02999 family)